MLILSLTLAQVACAYFGLFGPSDFPSNLSNESENLSEVSNTSINKNNEENNYNYKAIALFIIFSFVVGMFIADSSLNNSQNTYIISTIQADTNLNLLSGVESQNNIVFDPKFIQSLETTIQRKEIPTWRGFGIFFNILNTFVKRDLHLYLQIGPISHHVALEGFSPALTLQQLVVEIANRSNGEVIGAYKVLLKHCFKTDTFCLDNVQDISYLVLRRFIIYAAPYWAKDGLIAKEYLAATLNSDFSSRHIFWDASTKSYFPLFGNTTSFFPFYYFFKF
jgi:hypothetical protein